MLSYFSRALLGDPLEAALAPDVTSYESVHADAQEILLPPMAPKGVTVNLLQSLNKNFALIHK